MSLDRQSPAFFESRYQADHDPWLFASSDYELNRYRTILNVLPKTRYHRAYEPGCSIGVLTSQLAERCDQVLACDISPTAVRQARERCASYANVTFAEVDAVTAVPRGRFDLVVFSEIGYYFSTEQLGTLARDLASHLESGGEFIAVHWLGHSADHVLHGDVVHEVLAASLPLNLIKQSRQPGFRIDLWRRA